MDKIKDNSRALWLIGIIGCILFGIGDWLLGFVDPGIVSEKFSVIRAGNGADYDLAKVVWTLALGTAGMAFLIPGFRAQADILRDEKDKPLFRFLMTLCSGVCTGATLRLRRSSRLMLWGCSVPCRSYRMCFLQSRS